MTILTKEELLEGKVYVTLEVNPSWIFLRGIAKDDNPHISPQGIYYNAGDLFTNFKFYRLATNIETQQMWASIRAGKFVGMSELKIPKAVVNNNYLIF